jgi:ankyrin repeat protein
MKCILIRCLVIFTILAVASILFYAGCSSEQAPQKIPGQEEQLSASQDLSSRLAGEDALRQSAYEGRLQAVLSELKKGVAVNAPDQDQRTALMLAAFDGHTSIVQALLDVGAQVDLSDSLGRTALMYAASGSNPETVALLLKYKADPNLADGGEHWTALMFAAAEGQSRIVTLLLEHGADMSLTDVDGETAADFARNNGHQDVLQILQK